MRYNFMEEREELPCHECNGGGQVACQACNSDGATLLQLMAACDQCDGSGYLTCGYCAGRGYDEVPW